MSAQATTPAVEVATRLADLRARADSAGAWRWLRELAAPAHRGILDTLFAQGRAPESIDGPTDGFFVALRSEPLLDRLLKALASLWMPWQGKSFDSATATGTNRVDVFARWPAKLVWPGYRMDGGPDATTAFGFETRVEPGVADPGVDVLVADYAPVTANPRLIVGHIRDELVELVPDVYLGKVFYRVGGGYLGVGFFALLGHSLDGEA
jgi:hypothetical protein